MRTPSTVLTLLALAAVACGPTVFYERDAVERIAPASRWAWSLPDDDGLAYDDGAIVPTERAAAMMAEAIETELAARGFLRTSPESAQFVVHFHVGQRHVTDTLPERARPAPDHVTRAPGTWGGYGDPEMLNDRTVTWEEGMLIVDALTPDLRTLVWRGVIVGEIPPRAERDPAPAIRAAVKDLLRGFP